MLIKSPPLLFFLLFFSIFAVQDSEAFLGSVGRFFKRVGKGLWNGIKKVGSFLAKNGNVLSAATALIPGVGPAISTGIRIASNVGRALTSTNDIRAQSREISRKAGSVQDAATMYALNPSSGQLQRLQQAVQGLAAHGTTLHKIDFNTGQILSTSQQTFQTAGRVLNNQGITHAGLEGLKTDTRGILGAQQITNGFLKEIDSDLAQVQSSVDGINNKVDLSNARLEKLLGYSAKILGKLDSVEKEVLAEIIKLSRELQNSFIDLNSELQKGFWAISQRLTQLSREMRDGLNELDKEIEGIGESLRKGVAAILLGQLEQDSKLARECYRSLMDEMNRNERTSQSNFELLLNANELDAGDQQRLQKLLKRLEDPERGVDACRAHFRAIYDPASSPFPTGDVFQKLKAKFLFLHPERGDWGLNEAVLELKSLNQMANQFLLHHINLFSLKVLSFTPKFSKNTESVQKQDTQQENEALNSFLLDSEEILDAFEQSFPLCPPSHALLEALGTWRLYCDQDPVMEENVWTGTPQVKGFPLGAVCAFECYGQRNLEPIVCGPGGLWSQVDARIAADLLNCTQAVGDGPRINKELDTLRRDLSQVEHNVVLDAPVACNKIKTIYQATHGSKGVKECTGRAGYLYWRIDKRLSWAAARTECQRVSGADLMSVHNFDENSLAIDLSNGAKRGFDPRRKIETSTTWSVWLGLRRQKLNCSNPFEWTDGSSVDYTDFGSGQPDCVEGRDGRPEHCGHVLRFKYVGKHWNDLPCDIELPSLCKVKREIL